MPNWIKGEIVRAIVLHNNKKFDETTFIILEVAEGRVSARPQLEESEQADMANFIRQMGNIHGLDHSIDKVKYNFDPVFGTQLAPFGLSGIRFRIQKISTNA